MSNTISQVSELQNKEHGEDVTLQGRVIDYKIIPTKMSGDMSFGVLEDSSGSIEVVIFPEIHGRFDQQVKSPEYKIIIKGMVNFIEKDWESQVQETTCSHCVVIVRELSTFKFE